MTARILDFGRGKAPRRVSLLSRATEPADRGAAAADRGQGNAAAPRPPQRSDLTTHLLDLFRPPILFDDNDPKESA